MLWIPITAATAVLFAHHVCAQGRLLRFVCSQLVIERIDPLVSPGMVPSPHTHQVVGGNSFNATVKQARLSLPNLSQKLVHCNLMMEFFN
jgi:hypothetical protein